MIQKNANNAPAKASNMTANAKNTSAPNIDTQNSMAVLLTTKATPRLK